MAAEELPEKSGRRSVARPRPSPQTVLLPALKLDLGIVVLFLVCLWLGLGLFGLSSGQEALVLLVGSVTVSLWLAWRTRRVLIRLQMRRYGEGADES